jgi:hypothetical protein
MSTMIFELAKLQVKHCWLDLATKDEYKWPHNECSLEQRQGWKHNLSKEGNLESVLFCLSASYSPLKKHSGHFYEIYPQPELPLVNTHYHMCQWLLFLQIGVYC